MAKENVNENMKFPENTIGLLGIGKDNSLIYYFRGTLYTDTSGMFLEETKEIQRVPQLRKCFAKHFKESGSLSFELFIEKYGETLNRCTAVYASYLKDDDYFRVKCGAAGCEGKSKVRIKRLMRENHWVALYMFMLLEKEHPNPSDDDCICEVSYDGEKVDFMYGDGVCEVDDDMGGRCMDDDISRCKRHYIRHPDVVMLAQLAGMSQQHRILQGLVRDRLFLDALPFEISFGPQWGEMVPKMIESYTTIPTRKSETFDFVGTDTVAIKIGSDKIHSINVVSEFGYAPKEIECTAEVDADSHIQFTIKDVSKEIEKIYRLDDLFRLHLRDWM